MAVIMRRMRRGVNIAQRMGDQRLQLGLAKLYGWACERLYHELAWAYDVVAWMVSLGRWGQWRRMALAHITGERVLELGFGTGALLIEGSRAATMIGVEPSTAMHRVAARRLAAAGVSAARLQGRAQALPLQEGSVDTVLATFPAPFILEAATLQECRRVTKPGGRLVIGGIWVSVELAGSERWLPLFYSRPTPQTQERWRRLLQRAGFAGEIVEEVDGIFRVGIVVATRVNNERGEQTHAPARTPHAR